MRRQDNHDKLGKKDFSQQIEHMQVPNGTGPGVRRGTRLLLGCHTRGKL